MIKFAGAFNDVEGVAKNLCIGVGVLASVANLLVVWILVHKASMGVEASQSCLKIASLALHSWGVMVPHESKRWVSSSQVA